jgi:hypothetical protein
MTELEITPQRRLQAVLTARSVMKAYGPGKAIRRVDEMSATREEPSPGNKQFYSLVRSFVEEAVESGTIDGGPLA